MLASIPVLVTSFFGVFLVSQFVCFCFFSGRLILVWLFSQIKGGEGGGGRTSTAPISFVFNPTKVAQVMLKRNLWCPSLEILQLPLLPLSEETPP